MTPTELLSFAQRRLKLVGQIIMWNNGVPWDLPASIILETGEQLIVINRGGEEHVIRHADLSWMLTHGRVIPEGMTVQFRDGNPANRDPYNLWLAHPPRQAS